jgi:hypothetical protein
MSAFHKLPACLLQSAAGLCKETFGEITESPATSRERYVPHDGKQDGFLSGGLKSLGILILPALCPSTNLEMIHVNLLTHLSEADKRNENH